MTIADAVKRSGLARLDAEVLLAHVLSKDRTWVFSHPEAIIDDRQSREFRALCARRSAGEPVAYITGTKEFYGRLFHVGPATLIPRPSTEGLVKATLEFLHDASDIEREIDNDISALCVRFRPGTPSTIVDVGTGSGVIAATLALEGRTEKIIAVDTSKEALAIAKKNFETFGVSVESVLADGIEFIRSMKEPFLIVSNPPYIPEGTKLDRDVKDFEPAVALFAGTDGMDILLPLAEAAKKNPQCIGLCLELRSDQKYAILNS